MTPPIGDVGVRQPFGLATGVRRMTIVVGASVAAPVLLWLNKSDRAEYERWRCVTAIARSFD
jgi:hypothetical protein